MNSAVPRLCVVSAANSGYFPGLLVTFYSLLRHLAPEWSVDFKLLTDGLAARERLVLSDVLRATGRDHTVEVLDLPLDEYRDYPALHGSKLAYARLLIPQLFPGVDRVLYVDSDIVVTRDVGKLAELPWPEDAVLYAVRDERIPDFSTGWEAIPCEPLGIPPTAPYFNSGFLWLNLAAWRRLEIDRACRTYVSRFPDRLRWHDQTVLNAVLWNRWTPLASAWNLPPERTLNRYQPYPIVRARAVNVHYIGKDKPWSAMQPLDYFYRELAAEIVARVPEALALRKPGRWEWFARLRYFVLRSGWHYARLLRLIR